MKGFILVWLLLAAIFAFYVSTVREGHVWDDDAAMYILHARNIAEGHAYADTGYIFNPDYPTLGPVSYPPGFPVLLAPIWALSGMNLHAMKLLEIVLFVSGLALVEALYRGYLGLSARLALLAIFGLCPVMWANKESVSSDFAFLPFLFAALWAIDRAYKRRGSPTVRDGFAIAGLIFASYSIRGLGMVLAPSLIAYDWLRNRRVSRFAAVTAVLAAGLCGAEAWLLHSAGGTLSLFRIHPVTAADNILAYGMELRSFWMAGDYEILSWLIYWVATFAAAWGLVARALSGGLRIAEVFLVFYVLVLLIYRPSEVRFLFPVFPIYLALSLEICGRLIGWIAGRASGLCTVAMLAALAFAYCAEYRRFGWGPIRESLLDEDFLRVAEFVRRESGGPDVLLFRRPRFLTLLTGRRAATYAHAAGLGEFVHGLGAKYVIAANSAGGAFASDGEFLWPFLDAHGESMRLVYKNAGYSVYRALWW